MYDDNQPDLFDSIFFEPVVDTRSDLEKENETLRDLLFSYSAGEEVSVATDKLQMLIIKRMGRYLSESNRKRIILSSFYTIYRELKNEMTFANVYNPIIHDLGLRCYEWDDYLAEKLNKRRRR